MDKNKIHDRIENILKSLCKGLVEKDEAMRLALLAAVAGESIFFLGLPGTAKSMVSRRLKSAFKGETGNPLRYFEYLMNQFSTPDEIFGPVSLESLEKNEYKRIVDGYLPDAEVAFLDEIWKASPAIQNTLLTIINEKKFHNGNEVNDVPLKALISASNELPAENQGLEALWDRFLIRLMVNPVQSKKSFIDLVCGQPVQAEIDTLEDAISIDELEEWKNEINEITIPDDVKRVIDAIHSKMWKLHEENPENNNYYISDRRWMKIVHLLKTSAFLNGRKEVDLTDCSLIPYCIWNSNDTRNQVMEYVADNITDTYEDSIIIDHFAKRLDKLKKYLDDNFYIFQPKKETMNNGSKAYIISKPYKHSCYKEIPYYIFFDDKDSSIALFNIEKDEILPVTQGYDYRDDYFEIENNNVIRCKCNKRRWNTVYEYDIEMTIKSRKTKKQVNDSNKQYARKLHKEILIDIEKKLSELNEFIETEETIYDTNIFANKSVCEYILKNAKLAKDELEQDKVKLEEIKQIFTYSQYENE